jgi:hypothetical protein
MLSRLMSSFHRRALSALLLGAALSLLSGAGPARAGDMEDCNGPASDKVEAACAAVIGDAQRPADDRVKAYAARARFYLGVRNLIWRLVMPKPRCK